jgi:hypothetical protein
MTEENEKKENKAKNKLSVQEWDEFVIEKTEQIQALEEKMVSLVEMRADILMLMAEGDESAYEDLKECDENTVRANAEIESIKLLLGTVPARRAYSEGVELERLIPKAERVSSDISSLVADVRRKSTLLELSCEKLDSHLKKFGKIKVTEGVNPSLHFAGVRNLRHLGSILSSSAISGIKFDDDNGAVFGAIAMDKSGFSAWIDDITQNVEKRLGRAQEHASRLKGEYLEDLPEYQTYCPHCFVDTQPWREEGKNLCTKCMKAF